MSIEIERIDELDGGVTLWYMAKGHHYPKIYSEPDPFWVALQEQQGPFSDQLRHYYVRRAWARYVPSGDLGMRIVEEKQPKRGNFPVTIFDIWQVKHDHAKLYGARVLPSPHPQQSSTAGKER